MINEENINKMYDKLIDGKELTTKELNSCGFNSKDLAELINRGILNRTKRGYYAFISIDNLFDYGNKLIINNENDKAIACFLKCYELDSNHIRSIFRLFSCNVLNKNYEESFKYFEKIYNTDNKYYNADTNLYIYLLSVITDIPEKHKLYTKYMTFDNVKVGEEVPNHTLKNHIRTAILNQKFTLALKQSTILIKKQNGKYTIQDLLIKGLLREAINVKKESDDKLLNLVKDKQYQSAINFLRDKQKRHNLNLSDKIILLLCEDLIDISKNKFVPPVKSLNVNNVLSAIENFNYELALKLNNEHNNSYGIDNSCDTINLLLNDINSLILAISNDHDINDSNNTTVSEVANGDEVLKGQNVATFADIVNHLINQDLDNAFKTVHSYLLSLNKIQYESLIINLIKISLIENDVAFTKPITILTNISREDYVFDISNYIQEFYISLATYDFKKARIYLDIITKSDNLGQICVLTDSLKQVLEATEKLLDYYDINDKVKKDLNNSKQLNSSLSNIDITSNLRETIGKQNDKKLINPQFSNYVQFINKKHVELQSNKEAILLDPMDDESIECIYQIVENIPDMIALTIGTEKTKRIVLKYKIVTDERIDYSQLIKDGNQAYQSKNYDDCIKIYRQLLAVFDNPNSFVYIKLGLAYMKKGNRKKAINYLTIANQLNKKGGRDFSYLIESLKGDIPFYERKKFVKMDITEFSSDMNNNYYGIDSVDAIASLVFESGVKLEDACMQFGLDSEQTCLVKLIFARNYYTEEMYNLGDQLLNSVEGVKGKTNQIKALLDEIRKNKRFYKNRKNENFISRFVLKKKNH